MVMHPVDESCVMRELNALISDMVVMHPVDDNAQVKCDVVVMHPVDELGVMRELNALIYEMWWLCTQLTSWV